MTTVAVARPSFSEELRALARLAVPLAVSQAGQSLMGLVDTAMVGRLSDVAQGAAGLGNSLTFTLTYFGIGMMLALDPLVSQAIGANELSHARKHYWTGVRVALITSAFLCTLLALIPFILVPAGVQANLAQGASGYIWLRLPGIPATLLYVGALAYLQGVGRTKAIFFSMIAANIVNFLLDLIFVFGAGPIPHMGVNGAAIATTLAAWFQFACLSFAIDRASPEERAFDAAGFRRTIRIGAPVALHLITESGIFSLAGLLAATLDPVQSAAHQVALSWASVTFSFAVGIASAGAVRVGWAVGAENTPAARRAGALAFVCGGAFMSATALMFMLMPQVFARAMSNIEPVVATASALFGVTAFFQLFDGVQAVGAGVLRGAGDTRFTFIANVIGHWAIGLPVAYLLGIKGRYGIVGIWWGLSAGLTVVAIALVTRFFFISRKPILRVAQNPDAALTM